MGNFSLSRTKQCKKCPWKQSTNPHDIPDGYCEIRHSNLDKTIAKEGQLNIGGTLNIMACHHSETGNEDMCIGWLHNQLGEGNNIGLRIKMMRCDNLHTVKVYGKQHGQFKDTLPKSI